MQTCSHLGVLQIIAAVCDVFILVLLMLWGPNHIYIHFVGTVSASEDKMQVPIPLIIIISTGLLEDLVQDHYCTVEVWTSVWESVESEHYVWIHTDDS